MDRSKENHNSHILLVKQLIKPYSFRTSTGKQVKYLDVNTGEIKQSKIKELDTVLNYYDSNMEEYLDKDVESPFALTINKLDDMFIKKQSHNLKSNDLDNIRRFFQYSVLRNKRLYNKMLPTFVPISKNFTPSFFLIFASATNKVFEKKEVTIFINKSKEFGFICPHEVVYYIFNKENKSLELLLSVNKNIVVCLNLRKETNFVKVIEVDEEFVRTINCRAYIAEKNLQSEYIVGCEKDLIHLKEDIEEIKKRKS